MNITWHGQSCFEIIATPAKNSQIKIVIDPFSEELGLKIPKLEDDIVLMTHNHYSHNSVKAVSGNPSTGPGQAPFLISGPGEYEIRNVFIQGIASSTGVLADNGAEDKIRRKQTSSIYVDRKGKEHVENIIYTIETEDLKLCHLGNLIQKELTEEQLEEIGDIDILMIPIGGAGTISAKEALRIMAQIEPKITIPMYYALPKLKIKLDGLDKFLKPLGIKSITPEPKLTIKQKDISVEEAKVVVLKP
jgi:L-ascorbate metabolism protein UlaG (beta-lactamase superfamily)